MPGLVSSGFVNSREMRGRIKEGIEARELLMKWIRRRSGKDQRQISLIVVELSHPASIFLIRVADLLVRLSAFPRFAKTRMLYRGFC